MTTRLVCLSVLVVLLSRMRVLGLSNSSYNTHRVVVKNCVCSLLSYWVHNSMVSALCTLTCSLTKVLLVAPETPSLFSLEASWFINGRSIVTRDNFYLVWASTVLSTTDSSWRSSPNKLFKLIIRNLTTMVCQCIQTMEKEY